MGERRYTTEELVRKGEIEETPEGKVVVESRTRSWRSSIASRTVCARLSTGL